MATTPEPLPADARFASEINRFAVLDQQQMPRSGAVLFLGSSSVRLWSTLAQDFAEIPVINRGFGGSHISDSVAYADRIAIPYKPKLIVLFAGTNDIGNGKSPKQVSKDFGAFADKIHATLPATRVAFISISPTWARWAQESAILETNRLIAKWIAENASATRKLDFLDTHARLLGADGQPQADLLEADNLHLNAKGYQVLTAIVKPQILAMADKDGVERLPAPQPIVAPDAAKLDGPPLRDGDSILFRFRAPSAAGKVYLAGSFNGWAKNNKGIIGDEQFAMAPAGDGLFFKRVPVELKEQKYKYVYTDQSGAFKWVADPQVKATDTGGNSVLDFAKLRSTADELALTIANATRQDGPPLRDSDRVLFRFRAPAGTTRVYLAGSFNNFANNKAGAVSDRQFLMSPLGNGVWAKWVLLGALPYKYKFVVNGEGSTRWFADPHVKDKDASGNSMLDFATIENVKAP